MTDTTKTHSAADQRRPMIAFQGEPGANSDMAVRAVFGLHVRCDAPELE